MIKLLPLSLLTAIYALTLGSAKPLDLLAGAVLSAGLLIALRRFHGEGPGGALGGLRRFAGFFPFAWAVFREIVSGTWLVANVVVGRRTLSRPGIVAVPVGERTEVGVAVTALAITLSPGEVVVDVDRERQLLLVHVLDAHDPDALREHYESFYQRHQRRVFP